jgi:hypothetical protein
MKKAGTIIYAVGWTHHSFGTQIIRTAAILQLLLGNVGRAGGGVNALRGHSNIQGATDMAGVFDILPGYLKMPSIADTGFKTYLERITPKAPKPTAWDSMNYWSNTPKFAVSLLKALFGDAAKAENDWAFHYLPKLERKHSWTEIWDDMYKGQVKWLLAFGMNGVAIGPNSQKNIDALKKDDSYEVTDASEENWAKRGDKLVLADKLSEDVKKHARITGLERRMTVSADDLRIMKCAHPLAAFNAAYRFRVPLLPGDHVISCVSGFCGACRYCLTGRPNLCEDTERCAKSGRALSPLGGRAGRGSGRGCRSGCPGSARPRQRVGTRRAPPIPARPS